MDLSTTYVGLELDNPLVPSSSPLMRELDNLRQMEDAGAGAVILHSLFEEQVSQESMVLNRYLTEGTNSFAEALSYFPEAIDYAGGLETYLSHIHSAKAALDIPVIASLNGVSSRGWINYAQQIEAAGADAIELNIYFLPTDPDVSGEWVENIYMNTLRDVKGAVKMPVIMKLVPWFSSVAHMAKKLTMQGADGLALFNRFYQPDLDLDDLAVVPNLRLSDSDELRLPLRWIAILYGRINTDFALTSGVHSPTDVLKAVAAGASITMIASELLQHGIYRLKPLRAGIEAWLMENEYESLDQLKGSLSQLHCAEPTAYERANYMRVLSSYEPPSSWSYRPVS